WPHDDPRRRRRSALQLSLTATRAEDEVIVGKGRCRAHGVLLDEQTGVDHGDESTGTKQAPPPVILSGEGLPLRCATRASNPQPSDPQSDALCAELVARVAWAVALQLDQLYTPCSLQLKSPQRALRHTRPPSHEVRISA